VISQLIKVFEMKSYKLLNCNMMFI